jgi:hypothetical protein
MIVQYVIVALAVLAAVAYLTRKLVAAWRSPGCASGGCSGCSLNDGHNCAAPQTLVALRTARDAPPPRALR